MYDNTRGLRGQYGAGWTGQIFKHPSTFHTLALDPAIHHRVITSLNSFKADADYYNKVGRAHKMGIFLFGPPGTGKTSFIAAVANLMHYDVYCLDLSTVPGDKALRELEVQIPDKALIVMEDIDVVGLPKRDDAAEEREDEADPSAFGSFVTDFDRPPIGLYNRMPQSAPPSQQRGTSSAFKEPSVTLAGLLNFTDGLRSACAAQHIFIFTSNHPERLDPALTRPGRMDLHVELSYCTFGVFQQLCKSHMQVEQHTRSDEVKQLLAQGCQVTPAFVAGTMHEHRLDVNAAFDHIISKMASSKPNAD